MYATVDSQWHSITFLELYAQIGHFRSSNLSGENLYKEIFSETPPKSHDAVLTTFQGQSPCYLQALEKFMHTSPRSFKNYYSNQPIYIFYNYARISEFKYSNIAV